MRNQFVDKVKTCLVCASFLTVTTSTMAFAGLSHYVPGALGLKNGTPPPPGVWYAGYNQYYTADTYKNDSGDTTEALEMDIDVFANVNQFAWITEKKFLGGNYGVDLFVPFLYTDLTVKSMGETIMEGDRFNLGDLFIDPLVLCWYGKRWDAFYASGGYMPTGQYEEVGSPGRGYWTFTHQGGGTVYLDENKKWAGSARMRFLHSTKHPDTDIQAGNEAIFEYGFGKEMAGPGGSIMNAGLIGYSYFQLTEDSGPEASDLKSEGHAAGAEVQISLFQPHFVNLSLRYVHEYAVKNNTEGDSLALTIVTNF